MHPEFHLHLHKLQCLWYEFLPLILTSCPINTFQLDFTALTLLWTVSPSPMHSMFKVNTCAMVRTTMHTFSSAGKHLGMRSRLYRLWVREASGAVQSAPWDNWVQTLADYNLRGKSATTLIISNSSTYPWPLIFLQQLRTTCAYYMSPRQLIMLLCTRHTPCRCSGKWGYQLTVWINWVDLLCVYISLSLCAFLIVWVCRSAGRLLLD